MSNEGKDNNTAGNIFKFTAKHANFAISWKFSILRQTVYLLDLPTFEDFQMIRGVSEVEIKIFQDRHKGENVQRF